MKINKFISKGLVLGILFNNLNILSNANNIELPSRYQTLKGEYIAIDDSTKGDLHEIEIFGNTVQDENNLANIQSVGDLYVDSKGNPILDSEGRQQYKIEIISENKYSYGKKHVNWDSSVLFDGEEIEFTSSSAKKNYMNFKENTQYTFKFRSKLMSEGYTAIRFYYTDGTFSLVDNGANLDYFGDIKSYKSLEGKTLESFSIYGNSNKSRVRDFLIIEGNGEDYLRNKKELILPTQLQKVGDVADRMYWDNEKGRYVIEKNVISTNIESVDYGGNYYSGENSYTYWANINYDTDLSHGEFFRHGYIITGLKDIIYSYFDSNSELWSFDKYGNYRLLIRYPREERFSTVENMLSYLSDNDVKVYYQSRNPLLIETNIISKLKIPTYEDRTHIYVETENGINPTIKVTIDRLLNICEEAVEDVINNPSIEKISYARNLVNQMDECDFKEELQRRLNEISNMDDMILERKNSTSNVDVYIKSENSLHMALSTNQVTFEDYSGLTEIEKDNVISISINSSLPYELNAYMLDEIYNSNKSKKINMDRLNIRDDLNITNTDYKEFTGINTKLTLNNNCDEGNDIKHNIDLKLKGNEAYPADVYKTVIRFEAQQK